MKKIMRVLPLVAVLAMTAAIPASTQVVSGEEASSEAGANLPMLIAVNRLELTVEQMEEIHGLLTGLLETKGEREASIAAFEQEMIAFQGTAEELDVLLEERRAEAETLAEGQREAMVDAIDQIKGILTIKQGEALQGVLGGLLGIRAVSGIAIETGPGFQERGQGMSMPGAGRMGRRMSDEPISDRVIEVPEEIAALRERMEERFGDRAGTMMEGLEERMAEYPEVAERIGRLRTEMTDRPGQALGCSRGRGMGGVSMRGGAMSGLVGGQMMSNVRRGGGMDLIEQLVEVLELKLQAIE